MGRAKSDSVIRLASDLTDELRAEIERLYVGEERTIREVATRLGIRYPVISKYLGSKKLTRSFAHYAKKSPWGRAQSESWAMRRAIRRKEEREENAG